MGSVPVAKFELCNGQLERLIVFFHSLVLHIGQAIGYRTWWLLPTAALCGIGELLGWSGRLWSSLSLTARTPFLMQQVRYFPWYLCRSRLTYQDLDYDTGTHATPGSEFRHRRTRDSATGPAIFAAYAQVVYVFTNVSNKCELIAEIF